MALGGILGGNKRYVSPLVSQRRNGTTAVEILVEDSSPLVGYQGGWYDSISIYGQDPSNYTGYFSDFPSWHVLVSTTGGFSFNFQGSAIQVYGTRTAAGASFTAMLMPSNNSTNYGEGTTSTDTGNSYSFVTEYQQLLYSKEGLNSSNYQTLFLTTKAPALFILDYIVVTNTVGDGLLPLHSIIIDDTSPAFIYPSGSWSQTTGIFSNLTTYLNNGTEHSTGDLGAQVKLMFKGCGIVIYGSWYSGNFTASLDGDIPQFFYGDMSVTVVQPRVVRPGELLFSHQGLEEGDHEVVLINTSGASQGIPALNIDYAVVVTLDELNLNGFGPDTGTQSTSTTSTTDIPPTSQLPTQTAMHASGNDGTNSHKLLVGAVAGGVVGGVMTIIVFVGILMFIRRRRRGVRVIRDTTDLLDEDWDPTQHTGASTINPIQYHEVPNDNRMPQISNASSSLRAVTRANTSNRSLDSKRNIRVPYRDPHLRQGSLTSLMTGSQRQTFTDAITETPSQTSRSPDLSMDRSLVTSPVSVFSSPRQEMDGGVSLLISDSDDEVIPPQYDPRWKPRSRLTGGS